MLLVISVDSQLWYLGSLHISWLFFPLRSYSLEMHLWEFFEVQLNLSDSLYLLLSDTWGVLPSWDLFRIYFQLEFFFPTVQIVWNWPVNRHQNRLFVTQLRGIISFFFSLPPSKVHTVKIPMLPSFAEWVFRFFFHWESRLLDSVFHKGIFDSTHHLVWPFFPT